MQPSSTRRVVWAAAVAGAALVGWLAWASSGASRPGSDARHGGEAAVDPALQFGPRAGRSKEGERLVLPEPLTAPRPEGAPEKAGTLDVRVVSEGDRKPLAKADVWLLLETEESLGMGWASLAKHLETRETDEHGEASLLWGSDEGLRRIVAKAPGFMASETRLAEVPSGVLVLVLSPGLSISGQVVTETGEPVADLRVEARSVRRPHSEDTTQELETIPSAGAEAATATSDAEGSFHLEGLAPGTYLVRPAEISPTHVAVSDLAPSSTTPSPGSVGVLADAGARGVRLIVRRVGWVVLRLVDARTKEYIASAWATATLRVPGARRATTWSSYGVEGDATSLPRASVQQGPSSSLVFAQVPEPGPDDQIEARIAADGYKPVTTLVHLFPAPETRWPEVRWAEQAETVMLEPSSDRPTCKLVVDLRRDVGTAWAPDRCVLTLCRPADGMRLQRQASIHTLPGQRQPIANAGFGDLPAGEAVIQVYDGLSQSIPQTVTLSPEKTVQARVEFPPLTGAVFVLLDEGGRRVFDADALLVAPPGQDHGLPDRSAATRHHAGKSTLLPLAPGTYRFAVSKRGVGYDAGTFEVTLGSIATVTARLGPLKRFDPGLTAKPR